MSDKKMNILKANRLLQSKVGTGEIKATLIEKSQKLIDDNEVDFAPMAKEYIAQIENILMQTTNNEVAHDKILQELVEPIMQIKANAKMFDYALIGNLANIMLNFLETIDEIDKDVIEIVKAHQKTLVLIVGNEMKGEGGEFGKELTAELKEACKRYFAKQASAGKAIEDKDAFFIDG